MNRVMTGQVLEQETRTFRGSGGVSAENRSHGFQPAFHDTQTDIVYLSRFADGRQAPCHLLDGLPDELVVARDAAGRVAAIKASVTSGFVRDGRFYTREEAARQVSAECVAAA
ncbi:MAG TPA: hypothetical protein VNJ47_09885 [Nevskiales bacterium]|nr:hypothetical protein [Nevskiales bacterium]